MITDSKYMPVTMVVCCVGMKLLLMKLVTNVTLFFNVKDVNECRQNVCRPDQLCRNTRGGYKCIDLCPNGMTKSENGTCIGRCICLPYSFQNQ